MRAKINDLGQFLEFSSIVKFLKKLDKVENLILGEGISFILKDVLPTIKTNLKLNTPLLRFVNKFDFSIIDLDLLQIILQEQTNTISYQTYIDNSIFNQDVDYFTTINKIKDSNLIKNKYIAFEDPFDNQCTETNEIKLNSLNDIILSKEAKEKFEKFKLSLPVRHYTKFSTFTKDLYFLNRLNSFTTELNQLHIKKLIDEYEKKSYWEYKYNLKENNEEFCQYLKNKNIDYYQAVYLAKEINNGFDSVLRFDEEFINTLVGKESINKLRKKELIKPARWGGTEVSEEALKILYNIDNEEEVKLFNVEKPKENWDDVCIDKEIKNKILSIINQDKYKNKIFDEWNLNMNYGKGITMNLFGPPGTGKTLTVKAIANYLNKDLLTINFSELESKWVGETEKNISKAFKEAKEKNTILFFDEADSLTTKRELAKESWIISRTNTLLKELENFEGICIFATNFADNYDDAFNRRLTAHIKFNLPDQEQLKNIFKIHFPNKKALHRNVSFDKFSNKLAGMISGGDVKNIVLNAARIAATEEKSKINMNHLESACDMVLSGKNKIEEFENNYLG